LHRHLHDAEVAVRFIRTRAVLDMIGVGRTTLWEMVRDGCFPKPVRITERIAAYELAAVEEWMRLRTQGLTWPAVPTSQSERTATRMSGRAASQGAAR
jgi:predicted DNA-binding transcriptional regulator AlpA